MDEHTTHISCTIQRQEKCISPGMSLNEKEFIGVNSVEVEGCDFLPEPGTSLDFPTKKMTLARSQFPQVLKI